MTNIVHIDPPTHPLRGLRRLAEDADRLVARDTEIQKLWSMLGQQRDSLGSGGTVDLDKLAAAKKAATLSASEKALIARCEAKLQTFDAATSYEHDNREYNLKRSVIGERIALLVGAFPNAAPGDPVVYVGMLIENSLTVDDLRLPALDDACWSLMQSQRFIPSLGEFLTALREKQATWERRLWAIDSLTDQSHRMLARIESVEAEWREAAKLRAVKQARSDLDNAHALRAKALRDACTAQEAAAVAAHEVAQAMERLAECDAADTRKAQALDEALARLQAN